MQQVRHSVIGGAFGLFCPTFVVHGALQRPSRIKGINAHSKHALKIIILVYEHTHWHP